MLSQERLGLTGCLADVLCNAKGPSTPGLRSSLAMPRRPMLPSSMHTPWAESDRNNDFGAQYRSRLGNLTQSIPPRYLSVYASTWLLPNTLQHSIPGPWLTARQSHLIFGQYY